MWNSSLFVCSNCHGCTHWPMIPWSSCLTANIFRMFPIINVTVFLQHNKNAFRMPESASQRGVWSQGGCLLWGGCLLRGVSTGVILQFSVKKQRNKALFLENKAHFLKNKALSRIKVWVNFIYIIQNLLLNQFYCMLFSSWVLVFPLTICFII